MTDAPSNMICILTDQHRVDTLGCYGNDRIRTPHLDALAASGTRFDRFYTPTAICTPARGSFLTGVAPFRHRLLANAERNVGYREDLSPQQFTFPQALADANYRLGLVGKWHAGCKRRATDFGFEGPHFDGWHNDVHHPDYLAYLAERGLPPYRITGQVRGTYPNGEPGGLLAARLEQPPEATFEHYLTTRAIEALTRYAEAGREDGRPFFLSLMYFGPHLPYILPAEYYDLYSPDQVALPASIAETFEGKPPVQRNYSEHWMFNTMPLEASRALIAASWGYVSLIDDQIGRLLSAVDELGLGEETSVIFSADHGEFTCGHRLHDKGPAMYEDIYHIPGIVRIPGMPAGQVRDEFTSLMDLPATILELAGLDAAAAVDSRSLVPLVAGEEVPDWRDHILAEYHGHHFPLPQRMLRTDRYKLVINPESVNEMYDLQTDPHELTNRYLDADLASVRRELMQRLYELLRERGDNFYHWMTSMYEVGPKSYDTMMGSFETDRFGQGSR